MLHLSYNDNYGWFLQRRISHNYQNHEKAIPRKRKAFHKIYLFRCSDGKPSGNSRPPSQQRKDYVSTSYDCEDLMTVADILAGESEAGVRFRWSAFKARQIRSRPEERTGSHQQIFHLLKHEDSHHKISQQYWELLTSDLHNSGRIQHWNQDRALSCRNSSSVSEF